MLLQQSGLLDRAQKTASYDVSRNPCSIFDSNRHQEQNENEQAAPLRLKDMIGIFYALAAGFVVAFVFLICECVIFTIRKH